MMNLVVANDDDSDMDVGDYDDNDQDEDDDDDEDEDEEDDGDDGDGEDDGIGVNVEIDREFFELSRLHKQDCKTNEILTNQGILLKNFYDKIPADLNKVMNADESNVLFPC